MLVYCEQVLTVYAMPELLHQISSGCGNVYMCYDEHIIRGCKSLPEQGRREKVETAQSDDGDINISFGLGICNGSGARLISYVGAQPQFWVI